MNRRQELEDAIKRNESFGELLKAELAALPPEPSKPLEGWVNVYGNGPTSLRATKEEAIDCASLTAIRTGVHMREVVPLVVTDEVMEAWETSPHGSDRKASFVNAFRAIGIDAVLP